MHPRTLTTVAVNVVGGTAVLGSYWLGLAGDPEAGTKLWGGVPESIRPAYTVSMLLAIAGGLSEFADKSEIVIIRHGERRPDGTPVTFRFNYRDYERRKPAGLKQDIWLKPGDVIVVPGG